MNDRMKKLRDEAANNHVFESYSGLALYRLAGNSFNVGFKAGFDKCHDLLMKDVEGLIKAIENYLEVQRFLAEPNEDTCVSSGDFRKALTEWRSKYGYEN